MEVLAEVKYVRKREIGSDGRNSKVFLAFDPNRNAELVVKEIDPATISDPDKYFAEAMAVHASAHDRVVPVYWAGPGGGKICLAMPLMPGGSLANRIRKRPLRPIEVIQIAQDICEGVAHVHASKNVHLDIKPTNVLFDANGRACISDFGQALTLDHMGTADVAGHKIYTRFAPPEVYIAGGIVSQQSDVYQIGLTLYRALNGERNFQEQWSSISGPPALAIANGDFPERSFFPQIPLGLRKVILKALDLSPRLRQVSPRAMAEELAAVKVRYDWDPEMDSDDETVWRLKRSGRSDILVIRNGTLPSMSVEIWTDTDGCRRKKDPAAWSNHVRTKNQLKKAMSAAFRAAVA